AVYDNIRRTGDLVEDYEKKLGLYRRFTRRQELYQLMHQSLHEPEKLEHYIKELEDLE
ncbi:DNA-binding protein, partial [Staphylococcus chromogenes]